ncbi:hypothetical protein ACIQU6_11510 [Streptomyces sp. NPDC090442]
MSIEVRKMIAPVIEVGYAAVLRDMREGDFDSDFQEWWPDLFGE